MKKVTILKSHYEIKFSGDDFKSALNVVKSLIGREFNMATRTWYAPITEENTKILIENKFIEKPQTAQKPTEKSPSLKIPGLFQFQNEGVQFIDNIKYGINGDECGLGKTIQAIGLSIIHKTKGPFIIICTASMKLKWAREIKKWTGEDAYIIYGEKESDLPRARFYIINYHILGRENEWEKKIEAHRKKEFSKLEKAREKLCIANDEPYSPLKYKPNEISVEGWVDSLIDRKPYAIIPDEAHRLGNKKAIWTRCFIKLVRKSKPQYLYPLSGTPIRKYPKNFWVLLNLINPFLFANEYAYLYRYCDPKHNGFGWSFNGSSNEDELNTKLQAVMLRRLKTDVFKELPPKIANVIPMALDAIGKKNYKLATKQLTMLMKKHASKLKINNSLASLKIQIYMAKRNSIFQWIDDFLGDHDKLVIAGWHRVVIDDIMERYKKCAVRIQGSMKAKDRQFAEDSFQKNKKIKIIALNFEAGGEGITLTASYSLAFVEFPDTPGQVIQVCDRIHRIGQKSSEVNIYFLFADGTIENDIADTLEASMNSVNKIIDGNENANTVCNFNELMLKNLIR